MRLNISKSNKDKIYLSLSVACIIASLCIIAWIDRQELDKKIVEKAALICAEKNTARQSSTQSQTNSQSTDANASIESKSEAEKSLENIDTIMKSVENDSLATQ